MTAVRILWRSVLAAAGVALPLRAGPVDFPCLLQAQASGAKVIYLAMSGQDVASCIILAELGRVDGPGHAWIAPERVRALAGDAPPGWDEGFAATVAYAPGNRWTGAGGALRAYIEHD